jgi:hypothetical protein
MTQVKLDKPRNLKLGFKALMTIEKGLRQPLGKVDFKNITFEQIAIIADGGRLATTAERHTAALLHSNKRKGRCWQWITNLINRAKIVLTKSTSGWTRATMYSQPTAKSS